MATLPRRWFFRLMNLYPPFLGAGIRIVQVAPDLRTFRVRMKLRFFNRNYVGTHYGGSLYSMCDPFFMVILLEALGSDYIVWDKRATIRFVKPGRGPVEALFHVDDERLREIREAADRDGKVEPRFAVDVKDADGDTVARVEKLLHVRRKR